MGSFMSLVRSDGRGQDVDMFLNFESESRACVVCCET